MEDLLKIEIEFPAGVTQGGNTTETLTTVVKEAFLDVGVESSVVQAGVEPADLRTESQLEVDPGSAALVIATIGVGMELVRIAVDLYKQDRELRADNRRHRQDIELKRAGLQLERERFEAEWQKHEATSKADDTRRKVDQEHIRELLDGVLTAKLTEQYHIQCPEYRFTLVQRSQG